MNESKPMLSPCLFFLPVFEQLRDGPVDLVEGGGGGGRICKKEKFAEPQKGIKKFAHATL